LKTSSEMGINLDNYEQYFLDHQEGSLSPEKERELSDFLLAHPELQPLLDEFDATPIPAGEPVIFHKKEGLKKRIHGTSLIHEGNAEEWMISSVEGLLNKDQEKELSEFLELNPSFRHEMDLFRKTKIMADPEIIFLNKNSLKKQTPVFIISRIVWASTAVAAIILLFFGIRYFELKEEMPTPLPQQEVATILETPAPQVKKNNYINESKPQDTFGQLSDDPVKEVKEENTVPRFTVSRLEKNTDYVLIKNRRKPKAFVPEKREIEVLSTFEKKEPSIIGRMAENLLARTGETVRDNTRLDKIRKPKMNIWNMLSTGIKGYNKISDRDIELYVRKDEDGKVSYYALVEQDRMILSKDLKKE